MCFSSATSKRPPPHLLYSMDLLDKSEISINFGSSETQLRPRERSESLEISQILQLSIIQLTFMNFSNSQHNSSKLIFWVIYIESRSVSSEEDRVSPEPAFHRVPISSLLRASPKHFSHFHLVHPFHERSDMRTKLLVGESRGNFKQNRRVLRRSRSALWWKCDNYFRLFVIPVRW